MTGRNFDTDPSSPGAIRGGTADTDPVGAAAEARQPNTDPGLGPAAPPLPRAAPPPVRPAGPAGRQDSVELLLEAMNSPQPERQKMTPQSAGEAAASYHAEHPVHPARTSPDEEPKVIVERPLLAPTVRVDRQKLQGVIEAADAKRRAEEAEAEAAAQERVPVSMGPRVLIAAVAGLVVVLGIFVLARRVIGGTAGGATATATATATTAATATASATATATATVAASGTSTGIPVSDTTATAAAPPPTAHVPISALPAAPATAKPKPRPTATSGDLGEFKPTFH
jgi:hypothetical protein